MPLSLLRAAPRGWAVQPRNATRRDWFGVDASHPALRMAELIEVTRAFLEADNGQTVRYRGEFYTIDAEIRAPVLGKLDVPILVGGFNKFMLCTAGRVADGVLGHGLFTDRWWGEVVEPELARAAGIEWTGCWRTAALGLADHRSR